MISVHLLGHDFKYEVSGLIKLFYPKEKINFLDQKTLVTNQSLLIESCLYNNDNSVLTKIIKDGQCMLEHNIDDINLIDIKENNRKKKIKIAIKSSLYKVLSDITNIKVPWGILTGIRPTKIVHDLYDRGEEYTVIKDILTNKYKINDDKANLIINIAKKERPYIYPLNSKRFSLYVSIPFCPTRCIYCSFPSNPIDRVKHLVEDYTDALLYEIDSVGKMMKGRNINTVYIGGGTPTALPIHQLNRIIKKIYDVFDREKIKEFTVEGGRPDTITKDMLLMLKENGVDRISINPQTMCNDTLSLVGRDHNSEDVVNAYNLAKEIGFNSINMDLIVGLPGEGVEEIEGTMDEMIKLNPDNLTVHTLAIKKASKLRDEIDGYSLAKQKNIEKMLNVTSLGTKKMMMEPYYMYRQKQILGNFENIGYSKRGKECIYNMLIMEEKETIIATGAGGVSKIFYPETNRLERVPNVKDINMYINRLEEMVLRKNKNINFIDNI